MTEEQNEGKNYHSRLYQVSRTLDPVIEQLKAGHIDEKYHWLLWLFGAPFRDVGKLFKASHSISSAMNTSLIISFISFLLGIGGGSIAPYVIESEEVKLNLFYTLPVGIIMAYIVSIVTYSNRLTDFNSEHFHTGAYRIFRKQEYDVLMMAFMDNKEDFYFKGLYDYVGSKIASNGEVEQIINVVNSKIDDYVQNERSRLLGEIEFKAHSFIVKGY